MFLARSRVLPRRGPGSRGSFGGVINANHRVPSKIMTRCCYVIVVCPSNRRDVSRTYASNAYSRIKDVYLDRDRDWDRAEIGAVTRQQIEFDDDSIDSMCLQFAKEIEASVARAPRYFCSGCSPPGLPTWQFRLHCFVGLSRNSNLWHVRTPWTREESVCCPWNTRLDATVFQGRSRVNPLRSSANRRLNDSRSNESLLSLE